MKKLVVGLVSAAALTTAGMAAASTSMAATSQNFSNGNTSAAGIFISGNLGYGKVDDKNSGLSSSALRGFTWNANLGYQFNKYFALEGGYTQFHNIKSTFNNGSGGTTTVNADFSGVSLLAKGIYPINDKFDVFAKAGAMNLDGKPSVNGVNAERRTRIVPEFGIGTSYNITHNVAFTVQGITTLSQTSHGFTMPATYAAYAGVSYKINI